MPKSPTAEMRAKAAAAKQENRQRAISKISDRAKALQNDVSTGKRPPASVGHKDLFRASYFRYIKEDAELRVDVDALMRPDPFGADSASATPLSQEQLPEDQQLRNSRLEVASLKRQVAVCRVHISSLEMEREAKKKEMRGQEVAIKQLKHQRDTLAERLAGPQGVLDKNGFALHDLSVEVGASKAVEKSVMADTPQSSGEGRKRHLKIVDVNLDSSDA